MKFIATIDLFKAGVYFFGNIAKSNDDGEIDVQISILIPTRIGCQKVLSVLKEYHIVLRNVKTTV